MIQSDKFDSLNMNIKKIVNITLLFIAKRLTEIFGFLILSAGIFLFVSLVSYSPEDPNFIFPDNTKIPEQWSESEKPKERFVESISQSYHLFPLKLVLLP